MRCRALLTVVGENAVKDREHIHRRHKSEIEGR